MPLISQFYGILIYIYKELGRHHNEPHIHVKYNEYEMSITCDCKYLSGNIPKKTKKISRSMDRTSWRRNKSSLECI